ncbi:MAG: hypothetical protein Q4P06_04300 [Actinomycetaceae bacterium]|nr:hypothetical protein [Actinomycetaceae bacterium]
MYSSITLQVLFRASPTKKVLEEVVDTWVSSSDHHLSYIIASDWLLIVDDINLKELSAHLDEEIA